MPPPASDVSRARQAEKQRSRVHVRAWPAAAENALAALGKWNVGARLHELRMPTLVICGDPDRSISLDQAFALAQGIAGGRLCIAPGCAHNVRLERPGFFATAVREFLLERSLATAQRRLRRTA